MLLNATLMNLLRAMSDGQYHSGEALGKILGISRAAVWKTLSNLEQVGVQVESIKGRGYRIPGGLSLLDRDAIKQALTKDVQQSLSRFEIFTEIPSTNAHVLDVLTELPREGSSVCLAEMQTAGRGRRGRVWQSPFARNIYLSLSWPFELGVAALEGLSLAVGVAIVEALARIDCEGLSLKWPNDVLYDGKKLGGVLLEISGDVSGHCNVVVGLGLNVTMPESDAQDIDQPWTDLRFVSSQQLPSRNAIVSELLNSLIPLLRHYERRGFVHYRERWQSNAAFMGERVVMSMGASSESGILLGVTNSGALRLQTDSGEKQYVGGEISMRPV